MDREGGRGRRGSVRVERIACAVEPALTIKRARILAQSWPLESAID